MVDIKKEVYNIDKRELVNENIPNGEVMIIDADGTKLGVFSKQAALMMANNKGLDLVVVSADARPMIGKLMNYSKFKFDQQKKQKELKKNQKVVDIKEIQLSPVIQENDINVKVRNARKFIENGDKVKVTLRFKGRMIAHTEIGQTVFDKFIEKMSDIAEIEGKSKLEGNTLIGYLIKKK